MVICCFIYFCLIIFATIAEVTNLNKEANNIVFDLPDLVIEVTDNEEHQQIEAFKSSTNQVIIDQEKTEKYRQLMWVSIGFPTLAIKPLKNSVVPKEMDFFSMKRDGFEIIINLLSNKYKTLLKNEVKRKYGISVDPGQIINLPQSNLECNIRVDKVLIKGKAINQKHFPMKIQFSAPIGSKERTVFQQRLTEENHTVDLDINCEITSGAKYEGQNILTITNKQLNDLQIVDKIFGKGGAHNESIYVTRNQVSQLSTALFQRLNIIEDYQLPESDFNEAFIQQFLYETASLENRFVDIDKVLSQLSPYNFVEDIKPDIIKAEFSRLFKVSKNGSIEQLVTDTFHLENLKTQSDSSTGISAGGGTLLFNIQTGYNYAQSRESDWLKEGKSFKDQLQELNTYAESDLQYERKGDTIVPKNIKISKIGRASFKKSLDFSKIKRKYTDSVFKREFTLNTLKALGDISNTNNSLHEVKLEMKGMIIAVTSDVLKTYFNADGVGNKTYAGWFLCDGNGKRPDLRGRVLVGYNKNDRDYSTVGNTGGQKKVQLSISEIPSHTHIDTGHQHYMNFLTSSEGSHSHGYQDTYYSEANGYISDNMYSSNPDMIGSGKTDWDNYGLDKSRYTNSAGSHSHSVSGNTAMASAQLTHSGSGQSHENRQPYYVVAYIIYLGTDNFSH